MRADLRHALRGLASRPGFSVVAIVTLALAIGATTAIFSVVDGVLLRATPVAQLDRLVMVWETDRHTGTTREPASVPDFLDFKRDSRTLAAVEGVIGTEVNFAPPQGEPVRLAALVASRGLLPMLGIAPMAGRVFSVEEDRARGPKVAVISESFWTRSFGRAPQAIGGAIRLDEETYTVVGVMPDRADFGMLQILGAADYSRGYADRGDRATADVWLPLQRRRRGAATQHAPHSARRAAGVWRDGLLRAGRVDAAVGASRTRVPVKRRPRAFIEPLDAVVFGPARPALLMLWGAVGLVLLIGCVNVANLLLIRGRAVRARSRCAWRSARTCRGWHGSSCSRISRSRLRAPRWASSWRRLRCAPCSPWRRPACHGSMPSVEYPRARRRPGPGDRDGPRFRDGAVAPGVAARSTGHAKSEGLHGASAGRSRRRTQRVLVMGELALAVMLVIGAALLMRSFSHVMSVDTGFHTRA